MSAFTPGLKLSDRYQLEELIGTGGMSQVWRARDLVLGRAVAVKVLAGSIAADPTLREGVRGEARAVAVLTHPNITAVYDYNEQSFPDGHSEPYLVMELLTGTSLHDSLPLPWPKAVAIGVQIASALAAAHEQGVVHRDIKPANVMLTPTGAKVLDFGIAASPSKADSGEWLVGTPAYSAPERLQQKAANPATDVYAVGVLLYEMITGRRPYPIETWDQAKSVHAAPPPLPPLPGVPQAIASVIASSLHPDPARRPNAEQLAGALRRSAPPPTLITPVNGPIAAAAKVPSPPTRVYATPPPQARKRPSRAPMAGAILIVVVLLLGGAMMMVAALRNSGFAGGTPSPTPKTSTKVVAVASPTPSAKSPSDLLTDLEATLVDAFASGDLTFKQINELRKRLQSIGDRWQKEQWRQAAAKAEETREWVDDQDNVDDEVKDKLDGLLKEIKDAANRHLTD